MSEKLLARIDQILGEETLSKLDDYPELNKRIYEFKTNVKGNYPSVEQTEYEQKAIKYISSLKDTILKSMKDVPPVKIKPVQVMPKDPVPDVLAISDTQSRGEIIPMLDYATEFLSDDEMADDEMADDKMADEEKISLTQYKLNEESQSEEIDTSIIESFQGYDSDRSDIISILFLVLLIYLIYNK